MPALRIFAAVLLLWCFSLSGQTLYLANGEWPPFLSRKLPCQGYVSAIVADVFRTQGIKVEYQFYPWARAEKLVETGDVNGSVVWTDTPARRKFAWFSDPVITLKTVLFHRKDRPIDLQVLADLKGLSMAMPLGSALGDWQAMVDAGELKVIRVVNLEKGFQMVLKGRVDFISPNQVVGQYILDSHFSVDERRQLTHHPRAINELHYRLMLSRKQRGNLQLLERFNQSMALLRESGEFERLKSAAKDGQCADD